MYAFGRGPLRGFDKRRTATFIGHAESAGDGGESLSADVPVPDARLRLVMASRKRTSFSSSSFSRRSLLSALRTGGGSSVRRRVNLVGIKLNQRVMGLEVRLGVANKGEIPRRVAKGPHSLPHTRQSGGAPNG